MQDEQVLRLCLVEGVDLINEFKGIWVDCMWMKKLFGLIDGWKDLKGFEGISYESLGMMKV